MKGPKKTWFKIQEQLYNGMTYHKQIVKKADKLAITEKEH